MTNGSSPKISWPAGEVPFEVFTLIANKLDREDMKALRLVNREFYKKLSGYYLQQLVIHVDADLCATLDTGARAAIASAAVGVPGHPSDSGRVLSNFGDHIQRFALALELKESQLVSPPIPVDEEIVVRPWGMYRWPVEPEPEESKTGLMTMADSLEDSQGLFGILAHLGQVQELGLSCEAGLGYLRGPDMTTPTRLPAIFAGANGGIWEAPQDLDVDKPYQLEKLEQTVRDANLGKPIQESIDELLRREGISLSELARQCITRCPLPEREREDYPTRSIEGYGCCDLRGKTLRVKPDMLNQAQKHFLLQHVIAQSALLQSYQLGLMDNASSFENLRKIRIASLPSYHIDTLFHQKFWTRLATVVEVSIAVVPDWRSLTRYGSQVEDQQVYPADAIPKVFRLFNEYIGKQQQIKHVHFEWLCGGELAPGRTQRYKHVLPAPFMKNHRKIIDSRPENLLILPHVKHLSLKNCWFTPHVFYRIIHEMSMKSLVSLELTSVSLSGPPRPQPYLYNGPVSVPPPRAPDPRAAPLYGAVRPRMLSWGHIIDNLTPRGTITTMQYLRQGTRDTGLIRTAMAMEKLTLRRNKDPKPKPKLRRLAFTSCGYVEVPDDRFIFGYPFREFQSHIEPESERERRDRHMAAHLSPRCCIDLFKQNGTDRHLARIVRGMPVHEAETLERVYAFEFGWRAPPTEQTFGPGFDNTGYRWIAFDAAEYDMVLRDGHEDPGRGRFTGIIEDENYKGIDHDYEEDVTPEQRYEGVFYPKEEAKDADDESADDDSDSDDGMPYDMSRFDRDYNDVSGRSLNTIMTSLEARAGYHVPS